MQDRPSIAMEPKRKGVNNKENPQKELDKLRIELSNNKNHQKFLKDQLLKKKKINALLNQQLRDKDEQIAELKKNQHEINKQLEEKRVKYDDLVKKYVMIKKEQLSLKKALESRKYANKKFIASLKKVKDHYKLKQEAKKEEHIS